MLRKPDMSRAVWQEWPSKAVLARAGQCTLCGEVIKEEDFTSEEAREEYTTSGMCQACYNDLEELIERENSRYEEEENRND